MTHTLHTHTHKCQCHFFFPRQNFPKNSKMEKSIIFASFLLILSITAIILSSCNYETQFSKQKLTCKNLQTTAGTFSIRAPPSFSINPPPPLQFLDWFCQHKYKPKKLYSHIILFSPTLQPNLKYFQNRMPHSPKNRAKRRRFSNQENQVITQTDFPMAAITANLQNNSPPTPTISTTQMQATTNFSNNNSQQLPPNSQQSNMEHQPGDRMAEWLRPASL